MKKLLSIVLALALVFTFMVPAFAEGTYVAYYVGDAIDGEAVTGLTAGETYVPDRMPSAAAPAGQYFVGWKSTDGKIYADGFTLAEGENKLTAAYVNYPEVVEANLNYSSSDHFSVVSNKAGNVALPSYIEGADPAYVASVLPISQGPNKLSYVEATESEVAYLKMENGSFAGAMALFLADENGNVIQGEWNKTYYIKLKLRVPYNEAATIDAETGETTPSPEVGLYFNSCFGYETAKRGTYYANDYGTSFGGKGVSRLSSIVSSTMTSGVDYTSIWNDGWANRNYGFGRLTRWNNPNAYSEKYTTDGWEEITFAMSSGAEKEGYLPVFVLMVGMETSSATKTVKQEIDFASIQVIDSTKSNVQYVVDGEVDSTVTGLVPGAAYNVDRAPTAAAPAGKYFAGWVDANGAAVTKDYKLAAGMNSFYAKYVDYATTIKPYFLYNGNALAYGQSTAGAISNVISSTTHWSNNKYNTENKTIDFWTTQTYNQENIMLMTDENGIAYQAEPNSTYKITVRAKNTAPDIAAINAANAANGATKVYTIDDVYKNQIGVGIGLKAYPALRSGNYASMDYAPSAVDVAFTDDYVDYVFTITTGDLTGINPQFIFRQITKPTLRMLNADDTAAGIANVNTYGANKTTVADITIEKIVGKVSYSVNGEAFGETAENLTIGDLYTIDRMPENTDTHYFSGWYFDEEFTQYARASFTVPAEPVTLYAQMLPYVENIHLSSSGAEGTVKLANWKFWECEGNWTDSYAYYVGHYKMVDGVYKDYMNSGGYAPYRVVSDGTVTVRGDNWNQSGGMVLVDPEGDALIPQPGAKYRVTVTLKSEGNTEGTKTNIFLSTGWKNNKAGASSKDGTFGANGTFKNWNSKYDYPGGGLDNIVGAYRGTDAIYYWTGEWQTVSTELTMPTIDQLKANDLASFMALYLTAPAKGKVVFKDIIIEKLVANVEYVVGDTTEKTVENLNVGASFVPEYTPAEIPEGHVFMGWKDSEGNVVTELTLVEGANKLYAYFKETSSVVYYVNGVQEGEAIVDLEVGEAYAPDRKPSVTPEGKYFAGWKDEEGNYVVESMVLTGGENKLTASFVDFPAQFPSTKYASLSQDMLYTVGGKKVVLLPSIAADGYDTQAYQGYAPKAGTSGTVEYVNDGTESFERHSNNTSGAVSHLVLMHDENGVAIQANTSTTYTVTMTYRINGNSSTVTSGKPNFFMYMNVGFEPISSQWLYTSETPNGGNYPLVARDDMKNSTCISGTQYKMTPTGISQWHDHGPCLPFYSTTDGWVTQTFVITTPADFGQRYDTDKVPVFNYFVSMPKKSDTDYCELDIKSIQITESSLEDEFANATINEKEVSYVKIGDNLEDGATYKITFSGELTADGLGWSSAYLMTANADNVNLNQGFIYNYNVESGEKNSSIGAFGYDWTQTFTRYFTVDLAAMEGNSLYMYVTKAEYIEMLTMIELVKIESPVAKKGVSMLKDQPIDAKQALRFYYDYQTTTGSDIVIDGKSVNLISRGFIIADASKVGDAVVTRATASSLGAVDANSTDFTKCWDVTNTGTGVETLTFSTYIKGFKAEEGSYNASQKIYVKGYVVLADGSIIYGEEIAVTVADVANELGLF